MSRALRQELFKAAESLEKADTLIKGVLETNDAGLSMQVLEECQNMAIALGNRIEAVYGQETRSVAILEEYCEAIFRIAEALEETDTAKERCRYNQVILTALKERMKEEIADRLEVVFLPYKAAMWDSMKSVWKAADKDSDCDAYVMPIPYFDKNPDGSIGEMHDESEFYEMEILDWKTDMLAVRMPDVVVIHNPYDEYNVITTIHPAFYVKELKKCAGKVVYIPYFVHQKDIVREHYCVLPGTLYTDKVILQSEDVKKEYMKIFAEQTGIKRGLEKKFIALGSPKFDTDDTKQEIPEEWKQFLYKDGKKKKVIFLNTHIVSLMGQEDDLFFEKMEKIFEVFKKQEDIVLLWRPHPLMRATAKAMNPGVLERYENLVTQYKNKKIGIYDETPDYHTALEIADAYYGCYSSLVEVFHRSEKPIMYMNVRI